MAGKSTNWGNYTDYLGPNHQLGRPPSNHVKDPRLTLIDSLGISFRGQRCCDVGSNDGTVGTQLAFDFGALEVVGVDIDPQLVKKADDLLALRSSRVRPEQSEVGGPDVDYFPMSAVLLYGRKPVSAPSASSWPRVSFIAEDWLSSANPATEGPYTRILALNVIKWLHLEHLDHGLVAFFRKCSASLASGGYLVIQLQPWDSYEKAVRPNKAPHFAGNLAQLKYRPETSFAKLLQDEGLTLHASSSQLRRRIDIYRKS
ncbi:hypothetical protein P280DRAFT_523917 [Massarina eburnea CBS 473.64]|uniref:RNA methyltransferase n=1 Tax=Massarina eburnea CBS 473.64 TaxID=1395130 RepID=A0A6A6RHS4_9PLEO|nr:hypothetical protein P280DRAFT_523917 [Massarina eburnea CBS 473.64]